MRDVVGAFPGARKSGRGFIARCPAHDDRQASLSIGRGNRGGWILKCHAGCAVEHVVEAAGLTMRDLAPENQERKASSGPKKRQVATYDYRDESDALLYQVVRYEPKTFRQRTPTLDGGWTWNLDGQERRVVYRLPELKGRAAVAVVEGEKDANLLWSHGLAATTNVGGAGKWRPEYAQQLHAAGVRKISIFPDNDDAGRAHALTVATSCHGAGMTVWVVALPDVPSKGDVSDWFARGGSLAALRALAQRTPKFTPGVPIADAADPDDLILVKASDVQVRPVDWVRPGHLAAGKVTLLVGDPGAGKTWYSMDVVSRVTRGEPWPESATGEPAPQGPVLYFSGEDDPSDTLKPRLVSCGGDEERVIFVPGAGTKDRPKPVNIRDLDAIQRAIEKTGAVGIVLDPLDDLLAEVDTHKNAELRSALMPLVQFIAARNIWVLAVAHSTKAATKAIYKAQGSIGYVGVCRLVLGLGKDPQNPQRAIVASIKNNLGPFATSLAYRIQNDRPRWEVEGFENVTADSLWSGGKADEAAMTWLREYLAGGDADGVPEKEIVKDARAAGIDRKSLWDARTRLRVKSAPMYGIGGKGWKWRLPLGALESDFAIDRGENVVAFPGASTQPAAMAVNDTPRLHQQPAEDTPGGDYEDF